MTSASVLANGAGDLTTLNSAEVLSSIGAGRVGSIIVGGADTNGVFRAKRVPASHLDDKGSAKVEFSSYMWVMDLDDNPQPEPDGYRHWWPSWEDGFGDVVAVGDPGTLRLVPWLEGTAVMLADHRTPDGDEVAVAPRSVLRRIVARAEDLGLYLRMAPEYEFFIMRETEATAAAKHFRDLAPLSERPQAYGAMQGTIDSHIVGPLVSHLEGLRVPVAAWAPEGGPGQYELNLGPSDPLEAADQGFLFKHAVKEICALDGLLASFMPKLDPNGYGSSLHVHQSLWGPDGEPTGHCPGEVGEMSAQFRSYVAGMLATIRDFALIFLPSPNAYKRLVPESAAGTTATWGFDNKTLSLRVVCREAGSARVEHRVPGADANVYLTLAAMIAGGIHGVENELELPPATSGNAYATADLEPLPAGLEEAIEAFQGSSVARALLGDEFVDYYAATRRWEFDQMMGHVTDWEFQRYLGRA